MSCCFDGVLTKTQCTSVVVKRVIKFSGQEAPIKSMAHLKFAAPEVVEDWMSALSKPNVTLYALRRGQAIFVELSEDIDVYSSKTAAFFYEAQVAHAEKLYFVPIPLFFRFAEQVRKPICDCLIISNTGRCGSTLLSQALEAQSSVKSISEPVWMVSLAMLIAPPHSQVKKCLGDWYAENSANIAASCMKIQLKEFNADTLVCVKLHSQATSVVPLLKEAFPEHKHMYLYRDPRPTVVSFIHLIQAIYGPCAHLDKTRCGRWLLHRVVGPTLAGPEYFFAGAGLMDRDATWAASVKLWIQDKYLNIVLMWASNIRIAERNLLTVPGMATLHYSSLTKTKSEALVCLFKFCGLPTNDAAIEAAMLAMEGDSQANSGLGKDKISQGNINFSPEQIEMYDRYLKDMGLTCSFDGHCSLPGNVMELSK